MFPKFTVLVLGLACALALPSSKVDPKVWQNLEAKPLTNVLLTFKGADPAAARSRFLSLNFATRTESLTSLYKILKGHADDVQQEVSTFLSQQRVTKTHLDLRQLWMSAELIIRDVDQNTLSQLAALKSVESIRADVLLQRMELEKGAEVKPLRAGIHSLWNIDAVHAPGVWALGYRGEGVVVASIDTGVHSTHESLRGNFRGNLADDNNYAWYSPTERTDTPVDEVGVGTHAMGVMVGGNASGVDIGIAPGATWIACRGCQFSGCTSFDILECGNWMGCPTNTTGEDPDCSKAPNVVANGFLGGTNQNFFDEVIAAWRAVGIAPVFSVGNSGPTCGSARSPGDRQGAIAAGATDEDGFGYMYSSPGPALEKEVYPNVAAPGVNIYSANSGDDQAYVVASNTGKSAHVAGVAALLYQRSPNLSVALLEELLHLGAKRVRSSGRICGDVPDSKYPNYQVGYGEVDALNSFYSF